MTNEKHLKNMCKYVRYVAKEMEAIAKYIVSLETRLAWYELPEGIEEE